MPVSVEVAEDVELLVRVETEEVVLVCVSDSLELSDELELVAVVVEVDSLRVREW